MLGKKLLLLIMLIFTNIFGTVNAQEVTVTGMGMNKSEAVRDASRQAVEQVAGVFIDSRTLMQNLVIQLDEVYKKSQGFVKNVSILEERQNGGMYLVKARVDVDTNPDAALMNKLTMLMMLNDPRIAVVVLQQGTSEHEVDTETILNERLMEMGFSHVVDAAHVSRLQNANMLRAIYNGQMELDDESTDNALDHLVIGESRVRAEQATVPDFRTGESIPTPIVSANAVLSVKILKYDTGDIISNFTTKGIGRSNNSESAIEQALDAASDEAAKQLEEKFKKLAAKITQGFQINVSAEDYSTVEKLAAELRMLSDVEAVYIRNHRDGRALLEVDSPKQAHEIIRILRQRTKLNIFVESISGNNVEMAVS